MGEIKKKQVCQCKNCGNEAEMVVTCSLEDAEPEKQTPGSAEKPGQARKIKGTATCSHCGNEADMWIDI